MIGLHNPSFLELHTRRSFSRNIAYIPVLTYTNTEILGKLFKTISKKGEIMSKRKTNYPVDPIFINRWSPRTISSEMMSDEKLMSLFEATRWAPSSYNSQPWLFIYAKRGTNYWGTFFNLLVPFNQEWAKTVVVVISRKNFEYNEKPSRTHSFDTSAAWENLALQESIMELVAHGIEGFVL